MSDLCYRCNHPEEKHESERCVAILHGIDIIRSCPCKHFVSLSDSLTGTNTPSTDDGSRIITEKSRGKGVQPLLGLIEKMVEELPDTVEYTTKHSLTQEEIDLIWALGQCKTLFVKLPILHEADIREFVLAIHQAQNIVLARAGMRQLATLENRKPIHEE